MKKVLFISILLVMLIVPTLVMAQPPQSVYIEYAGGSRSVYFMGTGSGLVQGWQYGHPTHGDTTLVIKSYDAFPNATYCDEGYVYQDTAWKPSNLVGGLVTDIAVLLSVFPDLDQEHLMCKYAME